MLVLGLCGSLRRASYNRALLGAAARRLPPGVRFELLEGLERVPPYNEDLDLPATLPRVQEVRDALGGADAILIATPEYNHSIPGQLKNVIDWASRPFPDNALRGKPVAVVGASTSMFGAVWAQAELRKVMRAAGACVLDDEFACAVAHEAFGDDGDLLDRKLRHRLRILIHGLLAEVDRSLVAA